MLMAVINSAKQELQSKISEKLSIPDYIEKEQQQDLSIKERFSGVLREFQNLEKRTRKTEEEIKTHKTQAKQEMESLRSDVKLKTYNEETLRIWKNFQNYAEYTDLKDLYAKTLPELRKFEDRLQVFQAEQLKTQTIIARFDEVLGDKASKQSIREIHAKFDLHATKEELWLKSKETEEEFK